MSDNLTPEDRARVQHLESLSEHYRLVIDHSRNMHWRSSLGHYEQVQSLLDYSRARIVSLSDDLAAQTKLAALADKAIEDAPHEDWCDTIPDSRATCNCFKADYAKAKGELL